MRILAVREVPHQAGRDSRSLLPSLPRPMASAEAGQDRVCTLSTAHPKCQSCITKRPAASDSEDCRYDPQIVTMATTMVTRIRTMTISTMTTIIKFMIVTMAMKIPIRMW